MVIRSIYFLIKHGNSTFIDMAMFYALDSQN